MVNFTEPYLSRSITEFWRRWHISLSDWLRDYLYISLGGNRKGNLMTYRNLMLTMLLGGLWHGASWNFVVWGALHGLFLAAHRFFRNGHVPKTDPTLRDLPSIVGTFGLVCFAWVFFRAESFTQAGAVLGQIATFGSGALNLWDMAVVLFLGSLVVWLDLRQRRSLRDPGDSTPVPSLAGLRTGVLTGCLATGVLIFSGSAGEPFIYFQF